MMCSISSASSWRRLADCNTPAQSAVGHGLPAAMADCETPSSQHVGWSAAEEDDEGERWWYRMRQCVEHAEDDVVLRCEYAMLVMGSQCSGRCAAVGWRRRVRVQRLRRPAVSAVPSLVPSAPPLLRVASSPLPPAVSLLTSRSLSFSLSSSICLRRRFSLSSSAFRLSSFLRTSSSFLLTSSSLRFCSSAPFLSFSSSLLFLFLHLSVSFSSSASRILSCAAVCSPASTLLFSTTSCSLRLSSLILSMTSSTSAVTICHGCFVVDLHLGCLCFLCHFLLAGALLLLFLLPTLVFLSLCLCPLLSLVSLVSSSSSSSSPPSSSSCCCTLLEAGDCFCLLAFPPCTLWPPWPPCPSLSSLFFLSFSFSLSSA